MISCKSKYHLDKIDFTTHFSDTPRYLIAGGVLIHSFIKNHQDIKHIKIHIIEDNVSTANKKKIQKIIDTDAKNYKLNIELAWIDISEEIKWCQVNNILPYRGSYIGVCSILGISQIKPISNILVACDATCLFDANLTKLWFKFYQSDLSVWSDYISAPSGFSSILYAFNLNHFSSLLELYRENFIKVHRQNPLSAVNYEYAASIWAKPHFKYFFFGSPRLTTTSKNKRFRSPKFYKWFGDEIFPAEFNAVSSDKFVIKWRNYAKENLICLYPDTSIFSLTSPPGLQLKVISIDFLTK